MRYTMPGTNADVGKTSSAKVEVRSYNIAMYLLYINTPANSIVMYISYMFVYTRTRPPQTCAALHECIYENRQTQFRSVCLLECACVYASRPWLCGDRLHDGSHPERGVLVHGEAALETASTTL